MSVTLLNVFTVTNSLKLSVQKTVVKLIFGRNLIKIKGEDFLLPKWRNKADFKDEIRKKQLNNIKYKTQVPWDN